jgi:hypothetical protein
VKILGKITLEIEASKKSKMSEKELKQPLNISKNFQKIAKLKHATIVTRLTILK